MASLWPWLAVAGVGALHGLHPAAGWMFAAAWAVRSGQRAQALWALLPIAVGHAASIALVAAALVLGAARDRVVLQTLAAALLVLAALVHLSHRTAGRGRAAAGHAGLALGSFMMAGAHGAGLMLVPALMPICATGAPTIGAPVWLALAAVAVHTVAMLAVTGLIAFGLCRGLDLGVRLFGRVGQQPPAAALGHPWRDPATT
jgi:hypothetical protein